MLDRAAEALAAWNRGDQAGVVANIADDVIWRDVALGRPLLGRSALLQATQAYMTAFPDLRIHVSSSTIDGPRLVQEWMSTGTHQGVLMGMAPTGRWIENYGAVVTTCDDNGLVIEGAVYWNPLEMFRQLELTAAVAGTTTMAMSASSVPVVTTALTARRAQPGGAKTRKSSPAPT
jgi:steroid delta-isomerase-like uncharacterized protein